MTAESTLEYGTFEAPRAQPQARRGAADKPSDIGLDRRPPHGRCTSDTFSGRSRTACACRTRCPDQHVIADYQVLTDATPSKLSRTTCASSPWTTCGGLIRSVDTRTSSP